MNIPYLFIPSKGLASNVLNLHFREVLMCCGLHTTPFINNKPIESVVLQNAAAPLPQDPGHPARVCCCCCCSHVSWYFSVRFLTPLLSMGPFPESHSSNCYLPTSSLIDRRGVCRRSHGNVGRGQLKQLAPLPCASLQQARWRKTGGGRGK